LFNTPTLAFGEKEAVALNKQGLIRKVRMRRLKVATTASLALLLIAGSSTGCVFHELRQHMETLREEFTILQGTVTGFSTQPQQIVVAAWKADAPGEGVLRSWFMHGRGKFRFSLQAPARYQIMAFEDLNGDFVYQENEPVGVCRDPSPVAVQPGKPIENLVVQIGPPGSAAVPIKIDISSDASKTSVADIKYSIGEVVGLDDRRFSPAVARLGLWLPVRFLREAGLGLYFLQKYDPAKIPVLFVHGAGGHPAEWRFLIDLLDRSRYQPWVYYYPSGLRLERQGETLYRILRLLQNQHKFSKMGLVAHSMGGLIARSCINEMQKQPSPFNCTVFITLATPWGGHEAAEMGIKHAPEVVPAWRDMAPNSRFLLSLWETPIPAHTAHYLLFSYKGKYTLGVNRNNDGVVSLESELDPRAQVGARKIFGIEEDHVGLLSSPAAAHVVNSILNGAEQFPPWVEKNN
jgi:pimeloyl-ACP methyl ester carboxylesterase